MRMRAGWLPLLFVPMLLVACSDDAFDRTASAAPANGSWIAMARGQVDVEGGLIRVVAPRDGRVEEVRVEDGDVVRQGDVLARLEPHRISLAAPRTVREAVRGHFAKTFTTAAVDGLHARYPERSAKERLALWQRLAIGLPPLALTAAFAFEVSKAEQRRLPGSNAFRVAHTVCGIFRNGDHAARFRDFIDEVRRGQSLQQAREREEDDKKQRRRMCRRRACRRASLPKHGGPF